VRGKLKPNSQISSDGSKWGAAGKIQGLFDAPRAAKTKKPPDAVQVTLPDAIEPTEACDWMSELKHQAFGDRCVFESTDTSFLSSSSLKHVRDALQQCATRKDALQTEAMDCANREKQANRSRRWLKWIPFSGYLFGEKLKLLDEQIKYFGSQHSEAIDRVNQSGIDFEITLSRHQTVAYNEFAAAFRNLSDCERQWDIIAAKQVDQFRERTVASTSVERNLINLATTEFGHVRSNYPALEFTNSNGPHLFFYPMLCIVGYNQHEFAALDPRGISLTGSVVEFHEEEGVPGDTQVVGTTWKRANKDGSADRRFKENYEIPIVQYGQLHFQSNTALNELYMFSNYGPVKDLCESFVKLQKELTASSAS